MSDLDILGINIGSFIVYIFVLVAIFLLFREIFCWYWKINIRVNELKAINAKLDRLIELGGGEPVRDRSSSASAVDSSLAGV